MNAISIIKILGEMGGKFPSSKINEIINYFSNMIDDGRVIIIYKDKVPYCVVLFSLGDNYEKFHKKTTFCYMPHEPESETLYIELLVSRKWDKEIREKFETELTRIHPQIKDVHWHRWASWGDRHVTIKRRNYV